MEQEKNRLLHTSIPMGTRIIHSIHDNILETKQAPWRSVCGDFGGGGGDEELEKQVGHNKSNVRHHVSYGIRVNQAPSVYQDG